MTAAPLVRACVQVPGAPRPLLERVEWLTPYAAETIAEDALRAGRGARLALVVPAEAGRAGLDRVRHQFAWLRARGLEVDVRTAGRRGDTAGRAA